MSNDSDKVRDRGNKHESTLFHENRQAPQAVEH
jgi:hypothetical protein